MRKTFERLMSGLLCVCMLMGMLAYVAPPVEAWYGTQADNYTAADPRGGAAYTSNQEMIRRLNALFEDYKPGSSYFVSIGDTKADFTGTLSADHSKPCTGHKAGEMFEKCGCWDRAAQCKGFAHYAQYRLFGESDKIGATYNNDLLVNGRIQNYKFITPISGNAYLSWDQLKQCPTGTMLYMESGNIKHYAILLAISDMGMNILDCNAGPGGSSWTNCAIYCGWVTPNDYSRIGSRVTKASYPYEHNYPEGKYEGVSNPIPHTIIVQNDGNGTASASASTAKKGETVKLNFSSNSGYEFDYWEVVSGNVSVMNGALVGGAIGLGYYFEMPNSDVVIKAHFKSTGTVPDDPVSVINDPVTEISETSAVLNGHINKPMSYPVNKSGCYIWEEGKENEKYTHTEIPNPLTDRTNVKMWFNTATEMSLTLKPGTKYYYQCFATVNGTEYVCTADSFTTLGSSAPTEPPVETEGGKGATYAPNNSIIAHRLNEIFAQYPPGESWFVSNGTTQWTESNNLVTDCWINGELIRPGTIDEINKRSTYQNDPITGTRVNRCDYTHQDGHICHHCGVWDHAASCMGFARYFQFMLFGESEYTGSNVAKDPSRYANGPNERPGTYVYVQNPTWAQIKNMPTGTHLRTSNGHSVILLLTSDLGMNIIDANYAGNTYGGCKVNLGWCSAGQDNSTYYSQRLGGTVIWAKYPQEKDYPGGYKGQNTTPPVEPASISNETATFITETSCCLDGKIVKPTAHPITKVGCYVWEEGKESEKISRTAIPTDQKTTLGTVYMTFNTTTGKMSLTSGTSYSTAEGQLTLTPGTKYYYQCFATVNGVDYVSAATSFTTLGTKPSSSCSGTLTSFGKDETTKTTIQLIKTGTTVPAYETTVAGTGTKAYSITSVAPGTYTVKVMKLNHVTREYTITVGDTAVTQNVKICLLGDVNGDGKITTIDFAKANSHARGVSQLTGYEIKCGDTVKLDGLITTADAARINSHASGKSLLW